jgi:hypothetical protein
VIELEHALQLLMPLLQGRQLTPSKNYVERHASALMRIKVRRRKAIKACLILFGKMKLV